MQFHLHRLLDGQVLIVPAFSSNQDGDFRLGANRKGSRHSRHDQRPPGPTAAAEPRLVLRRSSRKATNGKDNQRAPPFPLNPVSAFSRCRGTTLPNLRNTLGEKVDPATDGPLLSPPLPDGAIPSGRYVASRNVIITWSKEFDVAWGFSKSVGKWARQELSPPAKGPPSDAPIVSNDLAVWQVGSTLYAFSGAVARWDVLKLAEDHQSATNSAGPSWATISRSGKFGSKYYGYSGKTGRWDVLQLPAGHSPRVIVSNDLARILDGNDLYTFAASTGRWTSPQGKESAIETPPVDDAEKVQVYSLRNARAEDIGKLVWQLYSREGLSVVADPRTNSLIARGPEKLLSIVHALLTRLDEKLDTATSSGTSTGLPHAEVSGQVAERAKEYDAKEQQAAKLAQQLRDAKGLEPTEKSKLNGELRRAVVQSFAARQKFHEAEVAQLAARIRGIEQTISARQKIANQIIDRRVQDLLDPNLQWDQSSPLTQSSPLGPRADSAASTAADATKSSAPPPRITYGTWLPAEAEQIWNALGIKVRPFTPEEWSESKPRGALIVTEILRDAPDQSLRVNDIIERWQSQGGLGGMMRATLHIRRDMQTFPVTVEYPSPPRAAASRSSLVPPGKGAPPSTTSAVTPANRSSAPATPPSENLLPRVTVGNWFPAEAEQIWNALSIKVRPLTADDAPKPQYRGGLKIIEVPATGPASGLQVGDIIITLQTEGASKLGRRVSLRILRGEEIIPVTIEFPAGSQLAKIEDTMRRKASPNAQIVYGNWFLAEAEQVWKTLGIKVRPITPEEESASKPKGTMLITEILANSEDHGLRVGDIITALQNEGGYGGKQKATLNIRRGDENFPVTIEYSSAPPSATSAVPGRATATERPPNVPRLPSDSDLTSARAYRDKLRERWQTLETLYNGGKVRLEDNLQAAMELGAAELAAADAADQRRTAEEHVERVTRIKKIVQDKYSSGVEPVQNFFAAEAALIKAQAQLAAVIRDGDGASPNAAAKLHRRSYCRLRLAANRSSCERPMSFEQRIRDAEKAVADVEREFALVTDSKRRASMIGNRIRSSSAAIGIHTRRVRRPAPPAGTRTARRRISRAISRERAGRHKNPV